MCGQISGEEVGAETDGRDHQKSNGTDGEDQAEANIDEILDEGESSGDEVAGRWWICRHGYRIPWQRRLTGIRLAVWLS